MIWLSWRQFRGQALVAAGVLAALGAYLAYLGLSLRHDYHGVARCSSGAACTAARIHLHTVYETPLTLLSVALMVAPALIGAFWGAPLITRELEAGTHRLAWSQSATRRSWLAAKVAVGGLGSVVTCGLLSVLLTWAAQPYDRVQSRFGALSFDSRDLVPIAYAAFAFALGLAVGMLVKRTLPAMAITLALFAAVQVVMAQGVRRHLIPPVRASQVFDARTIGAHELIFEGDGTGATSYVGYERPGALVVSTSALTTASGQPANLNACFTQPEGRSALLACIAGHDVHWVTIFQPADRYWAFQGVEAALFLLAAGGLVAFCVWRIPRVTA
jgi:hypothetical protein